MKVMLAEPYTHGARLPLNFYQQPKLDGVRATLNCKTGRLTSRPHGENYGNPISVRHITEAVKQIDIDDDLVLDGELYIHGMELGDIISAVRRPLSSDHKRLVFMVFDVAINTLPFSKRMQLYNVVVGKVNSMGVRGVVTVESTQRELKKYHEMFIKHGFEGSIIRLEGPGYEQKRTKNLLKYVDWKEMDCVVVGFNEEVNGGTLGSLQLETPDGVKFDGTPKMPLAKRKEIWDNQHDWLGRTVVVKYHKLNSSGRPRDPIVKGLREDL